jgi:FAD/FMN-containing dehydrogenase
MDRGEFLRRSAGVAAAAAVPAWVGELAHAAGGDAAVRELARQLDGDVVVPGSARYATAHLLWDTRFDALRPRALAYCANAADVQRVVRWGRRNHVRVTPRSGGHSYGGYSSGNGVVVADVSRLKRVTAAGGTATVGAGAKLIDVANGLWQHRVAIPGGSCPTVGIAGLALGGGAGYSGRRLGLTSDNLRRLKIVTADGSLLTADAKHHADLLWASRGGGGGNFGIATELTFATHPVSTVATYEIEWPWAQAEQAVAAWQAFAPHAPDALFAVCDLIATDPSVPNARAHVTSAGQFFGSESDLKTLIAPLVNTGSPIRVRTSTLSYIDAVAHWAGCRDAAACSEGRLTFKAKSDYVNRPLSAAAIRRLVRAIDARQGVGKGAFYLDPYGGAINRVPKGATAFVHRDALFSIQYTAQWKPGGAAKAIAWLNGAYAAMRPAVSGFAYQNYIDPSLRTWQHAYYGSNLARLKAVKRKYDPHNAFRFAQSIPLR